MSRKNRENEYKRLIQLGREKDICPSLMEEFGKPAEPIPEPKPEKKEKKVKK